MTGAVGRADPVVKAGRRVHAETVDEGPRRIDQRAGDRAIGVGVDDPAVEGASQLAFLDRVGSGAERRRTDEARRAAGGEAQCYRCQRQASRSRECGIRARRHQLDLSRPLTLRFLAEVLAKSAPGCPLPRVTCPRCGTTNLDGVAVCSSCGRRLDEDSDTGAVGPPRAAWGLPGDRDLTPPPMLAPGGLPSGACPDCGASNLPSMSFCKMCGATLRNLRGSPARSPITAPLPLPLSGTADRSRAAPPCPQAAPATKPPRGRRDPR